MIAINWIDWRKDGNLIALGCTENIKIYDARKGGIVKTYPNPPKYGKTKTTEPNLLLILIHSKENLSIRWSPDSNLLVSAAKEQLKIIDITSDKILEKKEMQDESKSLIMPIKLIKNRNRTLCLLFVKRLCSKCRHVKSDIAISEHSQNNYFSSECV